MRNVTVYTDGSCRGNPGPGGWAAILIYNGIKKEIHGGERETTNNRMELTAVIEGLKALKEPCAVDLFSDSKYTINGLELGWAKSWKAKGWRKKDGKPALNPELWDELLKIVSQHEMHYHWVQGHTDDVLNNRCDQIAVEESKKYQAKNV